MKTPRVPAWIITAVLLGCSAAETRAAAPLEEARAALEARDFAKAAAVLEPLTGAESKDAAAFCALSQVRLAQKNTAEAVTLAERATVLDASKAEYFSQLGMALGQRMGEVSFMQQAMMSGKLRKAFAKAVELDPNSVPGLIGLARFYTNAPEIAGGSTAKAREYAVRVRAIAPFPGELELANIAEREDNFAEALEHLEAAGKLNPQHAWVQSRCGQLLAKLGRKDEARARFEAALKLAPDLDVAKKGLAELAAPAGAK